MESRTYGQPTVVRLVLVLACLAMLAFGAEVQADEWYDLYRQGEEALRTGQWNRAMEYFNRAIKLRPKPDLQAPTLSTRSVEYLPYYHLGQAYFFAGDYNLALETFRKAEAFGQVTRTARRAHLERFLHVTRTLLEVTKNPNQDDFPQRAQDLHELVQLRAYPEAAALLRDLIRERPDDPLLQALRDLLQSPPESAPEGAEPEIPNTFFLGLEYFVRGEYNQALQALSAAVRERPDLSLATGLLEKTRAELERINPEPQPVDTIRIRETLAPIFGLVTPAKSESKTSEEVLLLSATAADDRAIAFVTLTVNGQPYVDSTGQRVMLRPGPEDNPKEFPFSVEIPLQMGENQIVLRAVDRDSVRHETTRVLMVHRVLPWYRTARFRVILAAAILLFVGFILFGKYWKYRIAIINKYNPYIAGSPIRNEEMFFGREKLIKRILNTLHNNSLMIYGPRRIGKTSLQHQLKQRLERLDDPEYHFIPVFIDLQGTSEDRFFHTLMEEILEVCKTRVDGALQLRFHQAHDRYSGRDFSRDLKALLETLSTQTRKKLKLVLLMDEVDELNKYSEQVNQKLRSVFMRTFAESLVAVMSGAYLRKNWESEGSPWYNFFEEIEVPPFEREDAVNLICKPVTGIFSYEPEAVDKIIEYSECKPYTIQKFCVNVINRIIEEKRRRVTVADVEAVKPVVLRKTEETATMSV